MSSYFTSRWHHYGTPSSITPPHWDAGEGWAQTEVEGHVALVAHELLVGVLLTPAQVTGTGAAQLAGVVFALFVGWSVLLSHGVLHHVAPLLWVLDLEHLIHEDDPTTVS